MLVLKNIITSEVGRNVMSILLGIGLASLFSKVCKDRNCIVFKGKNPEKVKDKIFKYDENCYKYELINTSCNSSKKIVTIA